MAYPVVAIGNAGVAAPVNGAAPQMGGRNVVQLNQPAPQVLLQALDQARGDQVQMQGRLEAQVQQGEVALFQAAQRNAEITRQLNQAVNEANAQRNRANGLDGQLAVERQERANLGVLLRQWQDQEHVLRDQAENAVRLRDDIQRRLDAADARMGALEQQIVNERAAAIKRNRLNELLVTKAQLERDIARLEAPQKTAVFTSTIGGAAIGGIFGAVIGFVSSTGVCLASPCVQEEMECRRRLIQVENELNQMNS